MDNHTLSEDFQLPMWTSDESLELSSGQSIASSVSDLSYSKGNSQPGHMRIDIDGSEQSLYNKFISCSSTVQSPHEGCFAYQLPSPLNEESILSPAVADKERRREQNRVAQRIFRERKESKLKELEKRIAELKADNRYVERKYNNLRTAHARLQSGLKILLDASGTYDGLEDHGPDCSKD